MADCVTDTCNTTAFIADAYAHVFATSDPTLQTIAGLVILLFFIVFFVFMGVPLELALPMMMFLAVGLSLAGLLPEFVSWIAFAVGALFIGLAVLKLSRR